MRNWDLPRSKFFNFFDDKKKFLIGEKAPFILSFFKILAIYRPSYETGLG
jgi:hypothetical protein